MSAHKKLALWSPMTFKNWQYECTKQMQSITDEIFVPPYIYTENTQLMFNAIVSQVAIRFRNALMKDEEGDLGQASMSVGLCSCFKDCRNV